MATKALLVALAMVLMAVVGPVMAMDIIVGDDAGWKFDFDYIEWAKTKEYYVGDRLMFMYKAGAHNVIKANQTEFQQCKTSGLNAPFTSGNDIITLTSPGKKWYICGFEGHCDSRKMKLAINVLPQVAAPAPAPTTGGGGGSGSSATIGIAPSKLFSWMVAGLAIFMVIMKA